MTNVDALEPAQIADLLEASATTVVAEIRALGAEGGWRPAAGEWSANECVGHLIEALRDRVDDPEYVANVLWTQVLGTMHLARVGVGIRSLGPGLPDLFSVAPERVVQTCVESALALTESGASRRAP